MPELSHLNKKISTPAGIFVIVLVAIIAGGSILAFQYYWLPEQESKVPSISQLLDEIANWQTYTNEEYGFKIKHPKDWTVSIKFCENNHIETSKDCVVIRYFEDLDHLNIPEDLDCSINIGFLKNKVAYDDTLNFFSGVTEDVFFAGMPAVKIAKLTTGNTAENYLIKKGDKYFIVFINETYISPHRNPEWPLPPDCPENLENQMLSTFRFLE